MRTFSVRKHLNHFLNNSVLTKKDIIMADTPVASVLPPGCAWSLHGVRTADVKFQIKDTWYVFSWQQTSRSPACNGNIYIIRVFRGVYRSCELICTALQWSLLYLNWFISGEHAGRLNNYSGATKCIWGRAKIRILISGLRSPRLSSLHYVVFTDNV